MFKKPWFYLHMLVILAVALALRLINIDWDTGVHLHPDERYVIWVTTDMRWPDTLRAWFDTARSPLNPYNTGHDTFIYGTFPPFVMKAIATLLDMDRYDQLRFVGRSVSAVANVGSIFFAMLLGRRFFDQRVALLTGWLLAFTPLMLQLSRFSTVDAVAAFLTVAAFYGVVKSWDRQSIGWMAFAGVMVGLAGASKPNYLLTVFFLGLPLLELVRTRGWRALAPSWRRQEYPALIATITSGLIAFWTFRFAMPYAFRGPDVWDIGLNPAWTADLDYWRSAQIGLIDMKSMVQWADRTPVLYIVENMVWWGMGAALGLAVVAGMILAIWRILRSPVWPSWFMIGMVGWCVANIIQYGIEISQAQRYLIQVYPFLVVLAAAAVMELRDRARPQWIGQAVLVTVAAYTIVYGLAFNTLYVRPITRFEASDWIYENVPAGSVISNEYWDDSLPMARPNHNPGEYRGMTLDLYADESTDSTKATTLVGQLSQVDYLVLSSNRLIDSIAQQPERYPIAMRFYEMLLSGELGFEPVAEFDQRPEILGITWNDSSAEESLTVYEHPQVRIFRKTSAYDAQAVYTALNQAWGEGGYHSIPGDPLPDQMLVSDDNIPHAGWHDLVGDGLVQRHPLIAGWLMLQVVGMAAWPLVRRMTSGLPDAGWVMAKGVGLVLTAAITLALVSWASFPFNRSTILVSLLLVAVVSVACTRGAWRDARSDLANGWRSILAAEAMMLAVYVAIAWARSFIPLQPDGDLLVFTSMMRSTDLPPLDLWLSDGILHVHWAPLLPWVAMGQVLSLPPLVALNLAIVGLIALVFGLLYSVLYARTRHWLAGVGAAGITLGASGAFMGGLASFWGETNGGLAALAVLQPLLLILMLFMIPWRVRSLALSLLGISAGLILASADWGIVLAPAIVVTGMAVCAWQARDHRSPWWPDVRRLVLEVAGVLLLGAIVWYPALAAYTATARNMVTPSAWSLADLQDALGPILLLAAMVLMIGTGRVLIETTSEGMAGIVAGGIGIGTITVLLAAAIMLDVAVMVVLLATFLTIISAWAWFDHPIMSWSLAWILLGLLLLVYVQTRPFHLAVSGLPGTDLLLPVVWVLIGVGALLAGIELLQKVPRYRVPVQVGMAMLICAVLLAPTMRQLDSHTEATARQPFTSPAVNASTDEIAIAADLRQNTTGMPVLLAMPENSTVALLSGLPTVLGSPSTETRMRPGWESMVMRRQIDIETIYGALRNWDQIQPLLQQYRVSYIVVGPSETQQFGPNLALDLQKQVAEGHLVVAWQHGTITVYRVVETSAAHSIAPGFTDRTNEKAE